MTWARLAACPGVVTVAALLAGAAAAVALAAAVPEAGRGGAASVVDASAAAPDGAVAAAPAAGPQAPTAPSPAASGPVEAERPRVRLVATGGTISNRQGGRLTGEDLVALIPQVSSYARVEVEQYSNKASSQLTLDDYLQIARRIGRLFAEQPDLAGVVVTSGTDTLEELAYFLHLTIRDERPVVVVGAMRNPSTVGYEGAANLLAGFRVAADPGARGQGALVVLNDEINSAREVTKTDALRLHTFQSRPYGVLGVVDADRVVWYRRPLKRHTARSEFDVGSVAALPRVDVLMVYQDAPGDLIKAAVDLGAKGIVLATAGAGATSGTQGEGLDYAAVHGVFIVISTRTGSGRIAPRRPGGPAASDGAQSSSRWAYTVSAEDLTPVKARILLMLALTRTTSRDEIQRIFSEY
jgi:L-asparaginase